jgi:hypothetical protein
MYCEGVIGSLAFERVASLRNRVLTHGPEIHSHSIAARVCYDVTSVRLGYRSWIKYKCSIYAVVAG